MKKPEQKRIKYIGAIKNIFARSTFYISILNFAMLAVTSYSVVVWKVLPIPFWLFFLILVLTVVGTMVFDYIIMLPSEMSFMNWQAYEHNNPIRKDLEEIKKKLEEMEKKWK